MLLASTRQKFWPLTEILKEFEIFHTRNKVSIFTVSLRIRILKSATQVVGATKFFEKGVRLKGLSRTFFEEKNRTKNLFFEPCA